MQTQGMPKLEKTVLLFFCYQAKKDKRKTRRKKIFKGRIFSLRCL
jgi:hypothetical protein